jgi:hypothetical protein
MVKVIAGRKGTGKTKQMIELVNEAVHSESGHVVCIERGRKLTYDIHHKIRLVEASNYEMSNFAFFRGFISGMYACDYDVSHVFIDSLCRGSPCEVGPEAAEFLDWLSAFGEENRVRFTVMISADTESVPEEIKKYF